jgi:L-aspartate oxidase
VDEPLLELRNMILVAGMVIDCALQRKESRGLHCTLDYPEKSAQLIDSKVQLKFAQLPPSEAILNDSLSQ